MTLTEANKIRDQYESNVTVKQLATSYRVSTSYIYSILSNTIFYDETYHYKKKNDRPITEALALRQKGFSYADISRHLSTKENPYSASLVRYWLNKY